MRRRPPYALVLVAALAAFWAVVWWQSADVALTRVPVLDEAWYLREAATIRDDGILGRPFVMSPLYTLLVAALGGGRQPTDGVLVGGHPWPLLGFQAAAWAAIGGLIFVTVRGRAGAGAGRAGVGIALGAALLFWFYRPAAIYARAILLEVPLCLAVTAYLALLTHWRPQAARRVVPLVGAGLSLGLATLLRAHVLVLLVPGAAFVAWRLAAGGGPNDGRRVRLAHVAALASAALMPVALAAAHNTAACGRFEGPALNGGINLFLGNMPAAQGLFVTPAGLDLEREPSGASYLASRLGRDEVTLCAADRLWWNEAWREIAKAPARILRLWLRKAWLHLQTWEITQVTPLPAWPREVPILRALWAPYGLLVVLGLGGLVALVAPSRRGDDRALAMLWGGSLLLLIASQSLVFVVSRYRLVLAPPLCVLAGLGAWRWWPALAARRWREAWLPAAVAVLAAVVIVPWGLGSTRQLWAALETQNEARRWERLAAASAGTREHAWREAAALYRTLIAAQPQQAEGHRGLARVLLARGDGAGAGDVLADGLRRVARPEPLQRDLIELLLQQQRFGEARVQLESFLADHPRDADMLHNLTVLLGMTGRWEQALDVAWRLGVAAPTDVRAYLDLAAVQMALGRRDLAVAGLEVGLERLPGDRELSATLARLRARP